MAKKNKGKGSFDKYVNEVAAKSNEEYFDAMRTKNLDVIFGIPYQFMDDVDPRLKDANGKSHGIGGIYSDRIFAHMPLLFLTPCKQKFMPEFTDEEKSRVLSALIGGSANAFEGIESNGRYYTTEFDATNYYGYVNTMCREVACFLGIGKEKLDFAPNTELQNIDWQTVRNSEFNKVMDVQTSNAVLFYLDGGASMDDSFSNSTTESALASTINGLADQTNELRFLLGESSAAAALQELGEMVASGVSGALGSLFGGNSSELMGGMLADLSTNGIKTIVSGGKILFPKIWSNSEFDRSYNFNIKLRSPDHDNLSIFLNILVPYLHALAFVLPKQSHQSINGYVSPFLLRAYCKGFFNIDCGMVTGLSVTRGAETQWNDNGLPTQIDISMTIEDLYSGLSMTSMNDIGADMNTPIVGTIKSAMGGNAMSVVKNTAMVDYLSNLAGLNIGQEELGRRIRLFTYLLKPNLAASSVAGRIYSKWGEQAANWFYQTFYRNL